MASGLRVLAQLLVGLVATVLILSACGSEDPQTETPAAEATTTTAPTTTVQPTDVDLAEGCTAEPYSADDDSLPPADEPVVLLDRAGLRLCLGPVALVGNVVESANLAATAAGDFRIDLVLTHDGIDQFNQVAALCFAGAPDAQLCPSARLAIISGTMVASAPAMQAPAFERDQITISGNFTESEARDLASALVSEGMVVRPVLVDLGP